MSPTVAVAIGGMLGTVARYWLNAAIQSRAGTLFPVGILVVNILGCFAIGFIARTWRHAASVAWMPSSS